MNEKEVKEFASLFCDPANGSQLDIISNINAIVRMTYEGDENNRPNDHCNWQRLFPSVDSDFGWVENDDHLRKRILDSRRERGLISRINNSFDYSGISREIKR